MPFVADVFLAYHRSGIWHLLRSSRRMKYSDRHASSAFLEIAWLENSQQIKLPLTLSECEEELDRGAYLDHFVPESNVLTFFYRQPVSLLYFKEWNVNDCLISNVCPHSLVFIM